MKKWLLILSLFLFSQKGFAQIVDCCDDPICHAKAKKLVAAMAKAVAFLGPYPTNLPVDYKEKRLFIDSIRRYKPRGYDELKKAARDIHVWTDSNVSRRICVGREYENLSSRQFEWSNYFITAFYVSSFRSPEFAKGIGIHLYAGIGVQRLFDAMERFTSISGMSASYTFTPKGQVTGGHLRIMIGPGIYYSDKTDYLTINPRAEFRIGDIGNEMTTIGCSKLIIQGAFQNHIRMAGIGLAAELSKFNVECTGNYIFNMKAFMLQISLMYSIFYKKNK